MKNFISIFIGFVFLCQTLNGQSFIGISAGTSHYLGDLAKDIDQFSTGDTKAVIGFEYFRSINDKFHLGSAINFGALAANDLSSSLESHRLRSFDFRTIFTELQVLVLFRVVEFKTQEGSIIRLNASTGLAGLHCNTTHSDNLLSDLVLQNETPQGLSFLIPLNISLDIDMDEITYFIQGEVRKSYTDYIDGFSKLTEQGSKDTYGFIKLGARVPLKVRR
jgi:hypothetical protein